MHQPELILLKLGGSLITDKDNPHTSRPAVLARLASEIAAARAQRPDLRLIIGHGSGSFGHMAAKKHGTRQGVSTPEGWLGFFDVWQEARALNQVVLDALLAAGLPVIAFPPSAAVVASAGQVLRWDLAPIQASLQAGLLPLINGDVVFDTLIAGTILSTEDLFIHLARQLTPQRILLAGLEDGVWADFPACTRLIERITPRSFASARQLIGGSASVDVTGGMLQKVESMLSLSEENTCLETLIFSGLSAGTLQAALLGARPGTTLAANAG
jgi:isopentenyl phosphate kinase